MPPYQDAGQRPWGVESVTFGKYDEMFEAFYTGPCKLGRYAHTGREIFLNSCSSCHEGPGGSIGGHKAMRPLRFWPRTPPQCRLLKIRARSQEFKPIAEMEPHPWYSDAQMDALVAFGEHGTLDFKVRRPHVA